MKGMHYVAVAAVALSIGVWIGFARFDECRTVFSFWYCVSASFGR